MYRDDPVVTSTTFPLNSPDRILICMTEEASCLQSCPNYITYPQILAHCMPLDKKLFDVGWVLGHAWMTPQSCLNDSSLKSSINVFQLSQILVQRLCPTLMGKCSFNFTHCGVINVYLREIISNISVNSWSPGLYDMLLQPFVFEICWNSEKFDTGHCIC